MNSLTPNHLREMFLSSYEKIERHKEEINKVNVFPVPDQDTGTNLARTLEGIKKAIENKEFNNFQKLSQTALEGALISAQGNAGVIFTGFLSGFLAKLEGQSLDAETLAKAFEEGKEKAWKSILNPKEGTILDVIEATANTFKEEAKNEKDIIKIFEKAIEKAKTALLQTREKMPVLKKANVVDAGGLGFLMILESYLETLQPERKKEISEKAPSQEVRRFIQVLTNRYEVVALMVDLKLEKEKAEEKLKGLGDCLDIVQIGDKMKVHIHTDYPEEVRDVLKGIGKIEHLRIEDMTKEIIGEPSLKKVSIGIVTEDVACLLPKIIERYQIELTSPKFEWPELDKIEGENIYQKIKKAYEIGIETRPKTSQATPQSYLEAFKNQLQKFDKVLCITLSSKLSGCYNSALQAKEMLSESEKERVFIFDSLNVAAGQALLILRAIELMQEQREILEILKELKKLIFKTHTYIIFKDPTGAEFLGRITKTQSIWIKKMKQLGIHPIMEVKKGILA
ncbi:DAK2 domain-containing protein, partial [Candidatus Parcubacteria bacterium]|nr:DAK2 domain-containing protein [Candidatus Parcubacteria bacterium]